MALDNTSATSSIIDPNTQTLISINAAAQLPLKLSATNYPVWRKQFMTAVKGHGLTGYLDGTTVCPNQFLEIRLSILPLYFGRDKINSYKMQSWHNVLLKLWLR